VGTVGTGWYTLAEAAPVLGVSVDTVRRRLKRGELEGRQVHTQHGPTWEVCLGTSSTERQDNAEGAAQGDAEGDAGHGIVRLVDLVDRLQRENRDLAGQVGFLTAQLATATERLAAPEAPQQVQNGTVDASGSTQGQEPMSEPDYRRWRAERERVDTADAVRPWWRRWRVWLTAGLAVVVIGSASCQTSASAKHAGLCTSARATMDFWGEALAGRPLP